MELEVLMEKCGQEGQKEGGKRAARERKRDRKNGGKHQSLTWEGEREWFDLTRFLWKRGVMCGRAAVYHLRSAVTQ